MAHFDGFLDVLGRVAPKVGVFSRVLRDWMLG
jgi:hypothetical protein